MIDGKANGVEFFAPYAQLTNSLVNTGFIYGRMTTGVSGYLTSDFVTNSGFLYGATAAADLGGGNDVFDGRLGGTVGSVLGGAGDDVLLGGIVFDDLRGGDGDDQLNGGGGGDNLDGGAGTDLARYDYASSGVTAALAAPSVNTGEAAGDTFTSIEGLVGSAYDDLLAGDAGGNTLFGQDGNDILAGGAGADALYGGGGTDVLGGGDGNDTLYGGAGGDYLFGGAGDDLFVFGLGGSGDLVADFNAGGQRDAIDLRPLLAAAGYAGANPLADGTVQLLQNGADADLYVYGAFTARVANVYAPALDASYFLFR